MLSMRADAPRAGGPRLASGGASATRWRSTRVTAPRLRARAGGDHQGGADHAPAGARQRPAAVLLVRAQPQPVDGHAVRVRRLRAQHHEVRLPGGAPPVGPGARRSRPALRTRGAAWRGLPGLGPACGRRRGLQEGLHLPANAGHTALQSASGNHARRNLSAAALTVRRQGVHPRAA